MAGREGDAASMDAASRPPSMVIVKVPKEAAPLRDVAFDELQAATGTGTHEIVAYYFATWFERENSYSSSGPRNVRCEGMRYLLAETNPDSKIKAAEHLAQTRWEEKTKAERELADARKRIEELGGQLYEAERTARVLRENIATLTAAKTDLPEAAPDSEPVF